MNKQLSNDSLLDYAPVTFLVNQFWCWYQIYQNVETPWCIHHQESRRPVYSSPGSHFMNCPSKP
jgi:hypothetical protein